MDFQKDYDLTSYNSFAVPARAQAFCTVTDKLELESALTFAAEHRLTSLILGGGSNVLFAADYPGLVIHIALSGIEVEPAQNDQVNLKLGAGENWHSIVMYCLKNRFYGIENLALIPGTIGAAPIQNIGAYGVELADSFISLEAFDLKSGNHRVMDKADCEFGYRDSIFKRDLANQLIITSVTLGLSTIPTVQATYEALAEELNDVEAGELTPEIIAEAVMAIRQRKLPDPAILPNAGSFFKNPVITQTKYQELCQSYELVPGFPQPEKNGNIKIPAAWLLDKAGWKGRRQGAVGVHEHQAVVIVNHGGGTGAEVLQLANDMKKSIQDNFDVDLEAEVRIV